MHVYVARFTIYRAHYHGAAMHSKFGVILSEGWGEVRCSGRKQLYSFSASDKDTWLRVRVYRWVPGDPSVII